MIVVFYLEDGLEPKCVKFTDTELSLALTKAAQLRIHHKHVTISSEPSDLVGAMGVSAVENGTLPDGHRYEWSKAHRAGMKIPK